ncbi:hypothetical protein Hanom_Chr01g00020951 [Helianthus anomalus]
MFSSCVFDCYLQGHCFILCFLELVKFRMRVKCHFSPCGLGYFVSLLQRFHFSPVGPKMFRRCHFSPLG